MPEPLLYNPIGTPFIELLTVDSTNNYALTQARAGLAQHGMAFFAHEQLAGKGQRGKTWTSARDSSLILSVVVDPAPVSVGHQFQLSAAIAVAACEFLRKHAGSDVCIKWPNDLYWRDRKAGGILIENIIRAKSLAPAYEEPRSNEWQWAIAGIGININQDDFPQELKNPISLKQITGKRFEPSLLARDLCSCIDLRYNELRSDGFDGIFRTYQSLLYRKNQRVKLKKGSRSFEAVLKSVTSAGDLVVEHGIEESFGFGEIEWIIEPAN